MDESVSEVKDVEMKHVYEVTMKANADDIFTTVNDFVVVEPINSNETTETYHVDSELDLDQLFDTSDSVVSYREI